MEEDLKPYTSTRIKLRKFLSNNSFTGVKEEDLYSRNFIFDVYVLVMKDLILFRRKQLRNRSYTLERMHQPRFLQVHLRKRELKCLLSKNISHCFELYGKGRKEF